MLQIVSIRPGCTEYDRQKRIQGNLSIPLTEEGRAYALQLADQLRGVPVEVIYCPEGEPAEETGRLIADKLGVKLRVLDNLENINLGLWQGMLINDVRHKQPKVYRQWQEQPESVCPPQGEMLSEAEDRLRTALVKLLKRHKEGVIAIVLPEPLLTLLRRFLVHAELGDLWQPSQGKPCWEVFDVDPEALLAASV
jgi:broad specificity phosphatase PhoE